jgi:protein SCO1/2
VIEKLGNVIPLDLEFLNETYETVTLGQLIDKPTILNFVYYDCPGVCSPSLVGIEDFASKLDLVLGKDYQIITISFNVRDTPEKARSMKTNFIQKIEESQRSSWIYLTGRQDNIDIITDAVGYRYKPAGLDWLHPSVLVFLSPEGKITRYLYGLSFSPFNVKMALIEAADGRIGSSVNKILEICFSFDPDGRTYTLKTTTVIGGIIIFLAAIFLITLLILGRKKKK